MAAENRLVFGGRAYPELGRAVVAAAAMAARQRKTRGRTRTSTKRPSGEDYRCISWFRSTPVEGGWGEVGWKAELGKDGGSGALYGWLRLATLLVARAQGPLELMATLLYTGGDC